MSQQAQAVIQAQQKTAVTSPNKGNILQRAAVIPAITPVHSGILQRCSGGVECPECRQKRLEREGMLQRSAVSAAPVNDVPPIVHEVLSSPGQSLDGGTRAFMEPRFGYDFSGVRVHTDARAAESARAVNALAYTVGRDVVFGEGEYEPGTSDGRRLLAHELTHVVQQNRSSSLQTKLEIGSTNDQYEQEADHITTQVLQGSSITKPLPKTPTYLLRLAATHNLTATRFLGNALLEDVYDGKRVLRRGDSGVAVRLIQESLVAQGFALPVFGADSKFGEETEKAVRAFQISTGARKLDGIVGSETMQLLNMHDPGGTTGTLPAAPVIGPVVPPAASAVFSELPEEKFAGYDGSVVPNWLVVPAHGRREVKVTAIPAPARPTFVSLNPAIATVTSTPLGIEVTGVAAGTTDIEARQGAAFLNRLKISVKNRRDIATALHYVCDSAVPVHHCTNGTLAQTPRLLSLLNRVWERQANVRFTDAGSHNVAVAGDLGPSVDWTTGLPGGGEWNTVTTAGAGAAFNIFRVWHYLKDGVDQNDAGTLGVNTLIGDHPCADGLSPAHETGHFLGLDHPDGSIMTPCGGRINERVSKAMVDKVNP